MKRTSSALSARSFATHVLLRKVNFHLSCSHLVYQPAQSKADNSAAGNIDLGPSSQSGDPDSFHEVVRLPVDVQGDSYGGT